MSISIAETNLIDTETLIANRIESADTPSLARIGEKLSLAIESGLFGNNDSVKFRASRALGEVRREIASRSTTPALFGVKPSEESSARNANGLRREVSAKREVPALFAAPIS